MEEISGSSHRAKRARILSPEAMEEESGSSHRAKRARLIPPANEKEDMEDEPEDEPLHADVQQVKMSAGEIVKLLPSLSPGLSQALLRFLQERCTAEGVVILFVRDPEVEKLLEQVCEGFAAELKAVAAVEEGSSSDVILQLSFCLLLALAPSLPNACDIRIVGDQTGKRTYGGEQAEEVLYSALVSQHWSNAVRRLEIAKDEALGTDRACQHLAHLLESGHCKLQQLSMALIATGAGGMLHIARALRTNSSLTVLEIDSCEEVGDGGVEQLAAMLRTNSTLEDLTLQSIGMTAHGLGHLCDALSTQQSLLATSSSPSGTIPNGHMGGLKELDISYNVIGEGGAARLGAMLTKNRCLRTLRASCCGLGEEDGEGHLANGLRENSTLEELYISHNTIGKAALQLGLLVSCLATYNTSLKKLDISGNYTIGKGGAARVGAMLAKNRCLRSLDVSDCGLVDRKGHLAKGLRENSTLEELGISKIKLGKKALGLLVSCFATNNNTSLKTLYIGTKRGETTPAAQELAQMITHNQSLVKLGLPRASYDAGEWATVILPAFGRNKTLLSFDMSRCDGVQGQQVQAALFNLLRINTTIQEIDLKHTPLSNSGEAEAVEAELRRNKVFRNALSGLPRAKPKSCRIVLCGNPYAGKSSLLQTMKLLQQDAQPMSSSESEDPLSSDSNSTNWNGNAYERTRGIDIHLFKDDPNLRISVWDLAGHREFHALHDFMFPSGNNAATLFVFTFSPVDELRAGKVKTMEEFEQELLYWLRFITSNSKPNAAAPTVVVVITHKDRLQELGTCVDSWLLCAQETIICLASKFNGRVKVQPLAFMVNALARQDVELNRWIKEVEELLRSTLDGLEEEPAICTQVLRAVQQDASQTRSNSPIISRAKFVDVCRSLTPDITAEIAQAKEKKGMQIIERYRKLKEDEIKSDGEFEGSESEPEGSESELEGSEFELEGPEDIGMEHELKEEGQADNEPKFLAAIEEKIGAAVGAYLHDAGEVIHHDKLDLIISNPKWFCHGILGQLMDLFPSYQRPVRPKNGLVSRSYLSSLLQKAVKSVPGLDPTVVTPDQLIRLMLLLDLCYEQETPGDPHTYYLLPAIFDDEGNKAADGKRPLTWRPGLNASTFVGRRLQCADLELTFLTDGFFPRLQVVLHNHAFEEKWVKNKHSGTYKLEKNLFSIWVNGMEILIEFSGSSGYFVDILVKSSKSHQQTMEFLHHNIIRTIRIFCASQEGCQGVTLAEAIIRPECLHGAPGGNPILCTYRSHQSILVEDLKERMKRIPDYEHCWEKVEDGAVLQDGQDSGTALLHGPKDVASRHEPILDQVEACYPNTWKQGQRRGLALIVSMEKGRSGAAVDRWRLGGLFEDCGFTEVQPLVDPTASELVRKIKVEAEHGVREGDDCFLCSINAHGGTSKDGKPFILDDKKKKVMVIQEIIEPFRLSKHLLGKPKIFFINCCRVNFNSVEANHDDLQGTGGSLSVPPLDLKDCLLVFSTSEGFRSGRDSTVGTVFVDKLVKTMKAERQERHVLDMMTMVNQRVIEVQNEVQDAGTTTMFDQCCEIRHSLQRKLYWQDP